MSHHWSRANPDEHFYSNHKPSQSYSICNSNVWRSGEGGKVKDWDKTRKARKITPVDVQIKSKFTEPSTGFEPVWIVKTLLVQTRPLKFQTVSVSLRPTWLIQKSQICQEEAV